MVPGQPMEGGDTVPDTGVLNDTLHSPTLPVDDTKVKRESKSPDNPSISNTPPTPTSTTTSSSSFVKTGDNISLR